MHLTSLLSVLLVIASHAATYYVSPTGDNNNPGTQADPFLTVQKGANTAVGGDLVLLEAGVYPETVISQRHGTPDRITFDGQGVAQVHAWFLNHSNLVLQNTTVGGVSSGQLVTMGRPADYCILSNNVFDPQFSNVNVITFTGPAVLPLGEAGSDNLIISNTFQHAVSGLVLGLFGDRNRVIGNTFRDCDSVDWIRIFGQSNYIGGNTFSNVYESGISGNHPDWIQVFGNTGGGSLGHILENNLIMRMEGASQLCMMTADDQPIRDWTIRNNIFIGVSAKGTIGVNEIKWYNNIFYNCSTNPATAGMALIFGVITNSTFTDPNTNSANGSRVFNNVFLKCGDDRTSVGWYSFTSNLVNVLADYNYVGKSNYSAVNTDVLQRSVGDPGGWEPTQWWEDHGINGGDPSFVAELLGDFHLQGISILRAAGVSLADNTLDYDLVQWNSPPSIGAFEFDGEGPPPSPPTGVSVIGGGASLGGNATIE